MTPKGLLRQHHSKLAFLQRVADAAIVAVNLYLLVLLRGLPWTSEYLLAAVAAIALYFFIGESRDLYRSWRGVPIRHEISRLAKTWVFASLLLLFISFITKSNESYSRIVVISWIVTTPILLSVFRAVFRRLLEMARVAGRNTRTVAIVGATNIGTRLAQSIVEHPWTGMKLLGFYDDEKPAGYRPFRDNDYQVIGTLENLVESPEPVDLVYIALPMRQESKIIEFLQNMGNTTSSVYLVPDLFTFDLLHSRWTELSGVPVISVFESPFVGVEGWIKKLEDTILSIMVLTLILIPMVLIAIAIKVDSKGPVLFKQRRYGLDGKEIVVWKFRTMTVAEDGDVVKQATENDARATKLGKMLRKYSLDELPQFINVLQGKMSIVGPRPHAIAHNEEYRKLVPSYMLRHKVKPGITGWAQINGWRGETDTVDKMEKRVEYDLEYIRNWSLTLDIKIFLLSIVRGFNGKNVY